MDPSLGAMPIAVLSGSPLAIPLGALGMKDPKQIEGNGYYLNCLKFAYH